MTAVMVEITRKPEDVVLVADVEALTAGTVPGCNDDNPYR